MKVDLNFGVAKAVVSHKITNEFINESNIKKNTRLVGNLISTIQNSPILMKEYVVYTNIENKHIDNDIIATKYIDNNIGKFSSHSVSEINEAHKLLTKFVDEKSLKGISESKLNLYNSINTLIIESNNVDGDINKIHHAYEVVLKYLKENVKKEEVESVSNINENINMDDLVEIATKKFNEEFSSLNEDETKLVKTLVFGSDTEKKDLFESLKNENIKTLKSMESNGVADKINEAIDKLNKMIYCDATLAKDIVDLKNLKENLS